jgi:hypothetical protein
MHRKGHASRHSGKLIFFTCCTVIVFFTPVSLFASENYPLGSRAAAMGNAAVAISDLWSVHHNQAGLASLDKFQAGVHHENKFMVPEFALQALALALPARPGTIGLSYTYFGFSKYNESKLGLAFGRSFGERISAGVQINYLHTYIAEDYGNTGNVTVEGGFIAEPVPGLFIAAHIYNPSRSTIRTYYDQPLPVILRFGMAGFLGERLLAAVEAEKDNEHNAVLKAGIEMGFHGPLYLRAGIISEPFRGSFGIGYVLGALVADLAFTNHQALGFTPHFTLSYRFR